ncbi:hypothetical protein [Acinetobacter ursingii]|uniref:Carbon storage regulator n=1 Tax=Acinetobacter ursingii TaxID=108980 RepID=A0AA46NME2_9GAMM|nr:hypothetical protein [Acinetobacter ursingii]UYF70489.1 hypothetical protein LSO60_09290 [Acinetobacter ursingii]
MGTLKLDLRVGETLYIGESKVQLEKKSGQSARLSINAHPNIKIEHKRMSAVVDSEENQTHGKHAL